MESHAVEGAHVDLALLAASVIQKMDKWGSIVKDLMKPFSQTVHAVNKQWSSSFFLLLHYFCLECEHKLGY